MANKNYSKVRRYAAASVGESIRVIRELQELSAIVVRSERRTEMIRKKRLPIAALGIGAWVSSQAIYRLAIVPELPRLQTVPVLWWVGMSLPLLSVILLAAWASAGWRDASISGLWLATPPIVVVPAYGAATGQPIGHDMWVSD